VRERWEKIKEGRWLRSRSATFIDVESGGWLVYAPCLMRRALNPRGQTPQLRLLTLIVALRYITSFTIYKYLIYISKG
jgi:hypothetical protein